MKIINKIKIPLAVGVSALSGAVMCWTAGRLLWAPETVTLPVLTALAGLGGAAALGASAYMASCCRRLLRFQDEYAGHRDRTAYLENRCQALTRKLEDLEALHCLDSAAMSSLDLHDFMDGLARLAHENAGAREFAFFLGSDKQLGPKAYYHLDKNIEFCLTFTPRGSQFIARDLWDLGAVQASHLFARGMGIKGENGQIIIEGELLYDTTAVGKMRLSLPQIPDKAFTREELRKIVTFELSQVHLRSRLVRESLDSGSRFCEDNGDGVLAITMAVCDNQKSRLGVISVNFTTPAAPNAIDRETFLTSAARHFARAAKDEILYQQAICDGLTGLYNKRHLLDELASLTADAFKHNGRMSLLIMDIDHFKKVNDKHGHQTGDIILKSVAETLQENVRACDLACRYGGEELVALLPNCALDGAAALAERVRARVEATPHVSEAGKHFKVTASFGVAELVPGMRNGADLVAAADYALYEAKHNGRNQVVRAEKRKTA